MGLHPVIASQAFPFKKQGYWRGLADCQDLGQGPGAGTAVLKLGWKAATMRHTFPAPADLINKQL